MRPYWQQIGLDRHREMPKCDDCGHRRIHHVQPVYEARRNGRRKLAGEQMVPCALPDCGCQEYATTAYVPPWDALTRSVG